MNNPCIEELPGPPFSQMVKGAFVGSLRASKNQKNLPLGQMTCLKQINRLTYAVDGIFLSLSKIGRSRR